MTVNIKCADWVYYSQLLSHACRHRTLEMWVNAVRPECNALTVCSWQALNGREMARHKQAIYNLLMTSLKWAVWGKEWLAFLAAKTEIIKGPFTWCLLKCWISAFSWYFNGVDKNTKKLYFTWCSSFDACHTYKHTHAHTRGSKERKKTKKQFGLISPMLLL